MAAAPSSASSPAAARLFSPVVMLWVLLVGVFSFSTLVVLMAYAPDLKADNDGGAHAMSKSAVGYAGLVELLKARGDPVVVSRGPVHAGAAGPGLLILTPGPRNDAKQLLKIKFAGPTLIVMPKWLAPRDPLKPSWVIKAGLYPETAIVAPLPKEDFAQSPTVTRREGVTRPMLSAEAGLFNPDGAFAMGPVDSLQTLSGEGVTPILTDERGGVLIAAGLRPNVYILSDPDLLNTQGLKDLTTTRAALTVLDRLRSQGGPIAIDVTLHGYSRGRNIFKLAFEPPFLALTLCLVAAALMAGWQAMVRFGPTPSAVRAFAFGKRALVDNSSALIKVAGREPRMARGYAGVERDAVARLVGAPRDLDKTELDAFLDRLGRAKNTTDTIAALTEEAGRAKANADLMRVATRLNRWRTEMTRERQ